MGDFLVETRPMNYPCDPLPLPIAQSHACEACQNRGPGMPEVKIDVAGAHR